MGDLNDDDDSEVFLLICVMVLVWAVERVVDGDYGV